MIVKNESKVIRRCFDSVKDWIDYWVICDTGSTDGTQDIIREYFREANIPGELLEHKWVNFGHNRSLAVANSQGKADYSLLMDADFVFILKDGNFKAKMGAKDGYYIKYEGGLDYRQMLCVRSALNWRYIGVTHEYIYSEQMKTTENFDGFTFLHECDGGSRSDKFERDIMLLEKALETEPNNGRYVFYLAQSYKDTGKYSEAALNYERRIRLGGWNQETYIAMYRLGWCKMMRGDEFWDYAPDLLAAYLFHPTRKEALYELLKACRHTKRYDLGYCWGKLAEKTPYPSSETLFIEKDVHEVSFYDELALCAMYSGHVEDAYRIQLALVNAHIEEDTPRSRHLKNNLNYYARMRNADSGRVPHGYAA